MSPFRALATAAAAGLLLAGCSIAEEHTARLATVPVETRCVATEATSADARPPALTLVRPWFGGGDLWVALPDYPARAEGDTLVLRFPLVTLENGTPTGALGPPVVTATRRDAPGDAAVQVDEFTRAFGTGELVFWPASVAFPEAGCWTVAGSLGDRRVEFVVDIAEPD
jgi:hypothetical protein